MHSSTSSSTAQSYHICHGGVWTAAHVGRQGLRREVSILRRDGRMKNMVVKDTACVYCDNRRLFDNAARA